MPPEIRQLTASPAAVDKLARRTISTDEAEQVLRNRHTLAPNSRHRTDPLRLLLVGQTDGGRALTLVVEATIDPTTWLVVTGWPSTAVERRLVRAR